MSETDSLAEVGRIQRELRERYGPLPSEVKVFTELAKLRLLAAQKGVATIAEHLTDVQISFEKTGLDYDARKLKSLPFTAEATRYPPGFSIKKRGLKGDSLLDAISDVLYLTA